MIPLVADAVPDRSEVRGVGPEWWETGRAAN
jgi:hypothetical protein